MMLQCQGSVVLPWQVPGLCCRWKSVAAEMVSGAVNSRKQLLCWFSCQIIAKTWALHWSWCWCCIFMVKYCSKHSLNVELFTWCSFFAVMTDLSCSRAEQWRVEEKPRFAGEIIWGAVKAQEQCQFHFVLLPCSSWQMFAFIWVVLCHCLVCFIRSMPSTEDIASWTFPFSVRMASTRTIFSVVFFYLRETNVWFIFLEKTGSWEVDRLEMHTVT